MTKAMSVNVIETHFKGFVVRIVEETSAMLFIDLRLEDVKLEL